MTALSLTTRGLRRTRAGGILFGRAMRDAGRALRLMLSGVGLLLAGAAVRLKEQLAVPRARLAPVMRRWGLYAGVGGLCALAVLAGVSLLVFIAGILPEDLIIPADLPAEVALFAAAGVGLFLALRVLVGVLVAAGPFLLRMGVLILRSMGVLLLACGLCAALYALMQPSLREGFIAGLASACLALGIDLSVLSVLAVLAPLALVALVALISLISAISLISLNSPGPSLASVFSPGGREAAAGHAGNIPASPAASAGRAQDVFRRWRQAISRTIRLPHADAAPASDAQRRTKRRFGPLRGLPWTWIGPALLVLLALTLAWQAGGRLLAAGPGPFQGGLNGAAPAASRPAPPEPPPTGPAPPSSAPQSPTPVTRARPAPVQLLADGRPADVSWRSGYRNRTARQDDGAAISALSLPGTACDAAMIVVFGSASSDGARARNNALALYRARWLGAWTLTELARCPRGAPSVIVISLGQARSDPPQSQQRAVRLMALGQQDVADLLGASNPETALRRLAEAAIGDLSDYDRFEGCQLIASDAAPDTQAGPRILIRGLTEACGAGQR